MTAWIRRNGRALVISVLLVNLIVVTITLPSWRTNIGFDKPKYVVRYGNSITIGNTRWQLSPVTAPSVQELRKYVDTLPDNVYDLEPNSRLATYLLRHTRGDKPASLPDGYIGCDAVVNSGDRQWSKTSFSLGITEWEVNGGVSTICSPRHTEPLLVAVIVPKDARLTSVDIRFYPESWDDKKQLSNSTDLLVVRFDTG